MIYNWCLLLQNANSLKDELPGYVDGRHAAGNEGSVVRQWSEAAAQAAWNCKIAALDEHQMNLVSTGPPCHLQLQDIQINDGS